MRQALELALEALQDYVDEHGPWSDDSGAQYVLKVGKEALAQPEQEPMANVVLRDGLPTLLANNQIKPTDERLYTTPPQRKPMTDDEIAELWLDIYGSTPSSGIHEDGLLPWRLARAIEAAHGIKENT